jgi:hypothetical protein
MEMQQILEMLKAMQEERKANRIADRECMKQMMARSDDAEMTADQAKAKGNQEDLLARLEAKIDAKQTKTDNNQERTDIR